MRGLRRADGDDYRMDAIRRMDYRFHRGAHTDFASGGQCAGIENRCIDVAAAGKMLAHITEHSGWVWACVPTSAGSALGVPRRHGILSDIMRDIDRAMGEHDA